MEVLRLNNILSPCRDCTNRYVGCHSKCDNYKAFRAEVDEYNEKKGKQSQTTYDLQSFYFESGKNNNRHYQEKRRRKEQLRDGK